MKNTAIAKSPANIALIKYWGQRDKSLNIPNNDSISFNLSAAFTITQATADDTLKEDEITLAGRPVSDLFAKKVIKQLDRVRELAGVKTRFLIETENSFPTGAGIASSASGMSALSLAAASALKLKLSQQELSILARKGSGSASRSIPDGFVRWHQGDSDQSSYAESLYPADYWDLHNLVVVVAQAEKKVSSLAGHQLAETSPLYESRLKHIKDSLNSVVQALKNQDFTLLGVTAEAEALNMHAVMMTSQPSLIYWAPDTLRILQQVADLRNDGQECYFTIDAGANVHVLTEAKNAQKIMKFFESQDYVKQVIDNLPARGAHLVSENVKNVDRVI